MNHKVEAEKARQERIALDLLSMVASGPFAPSPDPDGTFDEQLATGLYNLGVQGLLSGIEQERAALPTIGSLFGEYNSYGPFHSSQDVLDSLRTYMVPAFDEERESLKIDQAANGRVLLAYLQPSQSEWVHSFFELQEETETWTALITAHIFVGGGEWLDENGFKNRATPFLNAGSMGVIVENMRSSAAEEMLSPKILTRPGMDGSLSVLTEFAYVDKWEEQTVQPGNVTVLDPSIETVEEGLTLDVRVLQVADNEYGIAVSYELLDLVQPIETQEVMLGGVPCVTASPKVIETSLESHLVIPDGGGAVFRTTRSSEQEIVLVIQFERHEIALEK